MTKMDKKLVFFQPSTEAGNKLPLAESTVSAGFPSPADDYLEERIDLNRELTSNASATFYARVRGESMKYAGIRDGDLLVIDRSKSPVDGSIVVCLIDGEFTVKRLKKEGSAYYLIPENPDYKPIKIRPENNATVWGVVTYTIHKQF